MKPFELRIVHFLSTPIDVQHDVPPAYSKKPTCPNRFTWEGTDYDIVNCVSEWKDFSRHGRSSRNMQPQHARTAQVKGSWGVGKFYFDVQTKDGKFFRIYYDRTPKDASDRDGGWILLAELEIEA